MHSEGYPHILACLATELTVDRRIFLSLGVQFSLEALHYDDLIYASALPFLNTP